MASLTRSATEQFIRLAAKPPWVTGGLLAAILLSSHAAVWLVPSVFEPLQAQSIDRLFRLRARIPALRPTYDSTVFLVPIDDDSVQRRDGYYLGREDYGQLVINLATAGVSSQFLDVIFAAPETEDGDARLETALREAGNVFVGMAVGATEPGDDRAPPTPGPAHAAILERQRWTNVQDGGEVPGLLQISRYFMTFPRIAAAARGIGAIDLIPDRDGVIRRVPLVIRDGEGLLPSLHLLVACQLLGVTPSAIRLEPGHLVLSGARREGQEQPRDIRIPINDKGEMTVNFMGPFGSLDMVPFSVVYTASDDRFVMEDLREELLGRIAIVTWFSTGRGDIGPVPTDPIYPRAGIWADALNTILTAEFLREVAGWQMLTLVELPLLLILYVGATRLSTIAYVLSAAGLFVTYLAVVATAFLFGNLILNLPAPLIVLVASTPVVAAYQFHLESEKRARVKRELAVAREIQMGTLPKDMPRVEGYDLAGRSEPADETGGDSFDVIPVADQRLMLLLGDATGHGIGPALSVTQVRAMLRVASRLEAGLDRTVQHINDQLADDLESNRFVTAFLGSLDPKTHQVLYHSAGQGPLIHFHAASGKSEKLGSSMVALGIFGGFPMKAARSIELAPGDILGLMTDGVFEQEDGASEQFGEERVDRLIREYQRRPMTELLEAIFQAIDDHRGNEPQADDVTVLLACRRPEEPE